jgi:hypothetical protein
VTGRKDCRRATALLQVDLLPRLPNNRPAYQGFFGDCLMAGMTLTSSPNLWSRAVFLFAGLRSALLRVGAAFCPFLMAAAPSLVDVARSIARRSGRKRIISGVENTLARYRAKVL